MGTGADMADAQRQSGLRAFQGLTLAFLVATRHQRFVRRVEIQPNNIQNFSSKRGSLDSLKVFIVMSLRSFFCQS